MNRRRNNRKDVDTLKALFFRAGRPEYPASCLEARCLIGESRGQFVGGRATWLARKPPAVHVTDSPSTLQKLRFVRRNMAANPQANLRLRKRKSKEQQETAEDVAPIEDAAREEDVVWGKTPSGEGTVVALYSTLNY